MTGKKILMICGDYCEDYETMVPFQALQAVGHTVHAGLPGQESGRPHQKRPSTTSRAHRPTARSPATTSP